MGTLDFVLGLGDPQLINDDKYNNPNQNKKKFLESIQKNNTVFLGKECDGVADCKYWSYIATQKKCLILKSCDKAADDDGVESGAKGCVPPTIKFVIVDFIGKAVTDGKITWEKTDCADSTFTVDASKTATIEYTAKCGKLKTIEGKSDGKACGKFETETAQPLPTFYIKTKTGSGDGNCEFASNPKIIPGK